MGRVMIPAYARPAHRRLIEKLDEVARFAERTPLNVEVPGEASLGVITSGVAFQHVREGAPRASVLKLGLTWPLPVGRIREFRRRVECCVVIEEGDPILVHDIRAEGVAVEAASRDFRFDELDVTRVRQILGTTADRNVCPTTTANVGPTTTANVGPTTTGNVRPTQAGEVGPGKEDVRPEEDVNRPTGKPPELCVGCPHRVAFATFASMNLIVTGDIGCYTLGVLPPYEAMDTCICMGASIGVGLGLRHVLPDDEARRVVSVIGDSTFVHSGITGLVEMAYNRPRTGHVVVILDNQTTAMTGLQEHPGTGRRLDGTPTHRLDLEALARACGIDCVHVLDPMPERERFAELLRDRLASDDLTVIILRRPCLLAAHKRKRAR